MRIRKYDFDYGRRALLQKAVTGVCAAGVLTPLWPLIARGADLSKAYPEELTSIEAYTKGKIKPGDVLTADNVDVVKDLLDPIAYQQVKTMGRRINIVAPTTDITRMFNHDFLEATLRNKGKARFDATGNCVYEDGGPWRGGTPFPEPKDGKEALLKHLADGGTYERYFVVINDPAREAIAVKLTAATVKVSAKASAAPTSSGETKKGGLFGRLFGKG